MNNAPAQDRVIIARILRERGNRGELIVESLTDVPNRMETLVEANVRLNDGTDRSVKIESAWTHQNHWVLKFAGVDSIDEAKWFRQAELWIPSSERGQLPAGEYFESDLIGCTLMDELSGKLIGKVVGFQRFGGPPLMEVTVGEREVLVPFVPAICPKVDLEAKTIAASLPEGLLEL